MFFFLYVIETASRKAATTVKEDSKLKGKNSSRILLNSPIL